MSVCVQVYAMIVHEAGVFMIQRPVLEIHSKMPAMSFSLKSLTVTMLALTEPITRMLNTQSGLLKLKKLCLLLCIL